MKIKSTLWIVLLLSIPHLAQTDTDLGEPSSAIPANDRCYSLAEKPGAPLTLCIFQDHENVPGQTIVPVKVFFSVEDSEFMELPNLALINRSPQPEINENIYSLIYSRNLADTFSANFKDAMAISPIVFKGSQMDGRENGSVSIGGTFCHYNRLSAQKTMEHRLGLIKQADYQKVAVLKQN